MAAHHRQFATAETADAARRELEALDQFRRDLTATLGDARPSYLVRWMLDVGRLEHLSADLNEQLGQTLGAAIAAGPYQHLQLDDRQHLYPKVSVS